MNIAILPARSGSKRITQKNIRPFCGRPVIEYSIEQARLADVFDRVIVSTDSTDIAQVARAAGAEVPFIRPTELADDFTPTVPVVRHAVNWLFQQGHAVDFVCCIYATAPFICSHDLIRGLEILTNDPSGQFVVPVTTFPYSVFRGLTIETNRLKMVWPDHELVRSQDLPEVYHDAAQFYWGTTEAWLTQDRIFSSAAIPLVIPRHRVQDLDTLEDWERAERMFTTQSDTQQP